MSHTPERLLLRIPKRLWVFRRGLAFCVPRNSLIILFLAITFVGAFLFILDFYVNASFIAKAIHATVLTTAFILLVLAALPTIFVRKDCSECQLSFYIIAHERNHLLLNSTDEALVEDETLKQTRNQLIPILLSDPKLCKDCAFPLRKIYVQATFNYLKERKKQ